MLLRFVVATLLVALSIERAGAADTPAPPLDMREYQAYLHGKPGNGTADIEMKLPTKLLGSIWFPGSDVFLTIDTAYSRWAVDAFCRHYVRETATAPPIDKGVSDDFIVSRKVDADSVLRLTHLKPGRYLVFGGFELYTGNATDRFRSVAGLSENGNAEPATVPTLAFDKVEHEGVCAMAQIDIESDTTALKLQPTVVKDVVLK